jgi:LPXTG-motif cell wall-anchored protein
VPHRRRIAATALTLAFAAHPAGSLAQNGAGDEQYQDPFAGQSSPSKPNKTQTQQQAPAQQAPQQQPSTQSSTAQQQPSTQSSTAQQPATTTQAAPQTVAPAADPVQLPRTGFDVIPLAIAGVALVAAGLVLLRRRAADGRD